MYDTENYLVTAKDIRGPWSEPAPLNNFGFDPSLFHDDDGRKYMVSMVTDHRIPKKYAGRLLLQEYDPVKRAMTGPATDIYQADWIFLEGPWSVYIAVKKRVGALRNVSGGLYGKNGGGRSLFHPDKPAS